MSPSLRSLLQEPTLHFLIIAGLVFAAYGLLQADADNVLEVDAREIEARIFMQELASGRELTAEQRQAIQDAYIEEQILVSEALKQNLDNDARIHNMLAQKMRHVLSADVIQPEPADLEDFYQANQQRYRQPATLTLEELVFDTRDPLPTSLTGQLAAGDNADALLQQSAGNVASLANASEQDLANIFSSEFADRVFAADSGTWTGPFISNRGQHWLRITGRQDAMTPPLDAIRERVRLDWIASEEESRLQEKINALRQQYAIVVNGADPQ